MHLGRSGEAYFVSDAPSDSGGALHVGCYKKGPARACALLLGVSGSLPQGDKLLARHEQVTLALRTAKWTESIRKVCSVSD